MAKVHYKYYLLVLLTVVATFNYLDRGVIALAMESLKEDFQLSDSQLGLMSGFAFAFFYAIAGIPIARWADRGNRNHVIALTTGLWSVMIVASSLVGNFVQLLLVRVGVAVGEAGCVPPAQSLISDYFNRAERPRAMAIYWLAGPLAGILSFLGGGWLIEEFGWRITFIVIGLPGILLALLVKFTLREPRLKPLADRGAETPVNERTKVQQEPLTTVIKTLFRKPAFRHIVMGFCVSLFFGAGIGVWIPAFFMRTHDMGAGELGGWLALYWGIGGLFSTYLGGFLVTRYLPNQERLQFRLIAVLIIFCAVFHALCYLSNNKYMALAYVSIVIGGLVPLMQAPAFAAIQSLVEERMRSIALAFIFMLANLIGLGLGPVAVGVVSDALAPSMGQESLRYALLLFSPGYLWCAFHNWKAAGTIEEEINAVEKKERVVKSEDSDVERDMPFQTTVVTD